MLLLAQLPLTSPKPPPLCRRPLLSRHFCFTCFNMTGGHHQRILTPSISRPRPRKRQPRRNSSLACLVDSPEQPGPENKPLSKLDQCLMHLSEAMSWDVTYRSITMKEMYAKGIGIDMGMTVKWDHYWKTDASFMFSQEGEYFNLKFGSPGDKKTTWEVDKRGVSHTHMYDDSESRLLTTWVTTGQWLLQGTRRYLDIRIVPAVEGVMNDDTSTADEEEKKDDTEPVRNLVVPENKGIIEGDTVLLRIKLKNGQVRVYVEVDTSTWLPKSIQEVVCGDLETWILKDWKSFGTKYPSNRMVFPKSIEHRSSSGGIRKYETTEFHVLVRGDQNKYKAPPPVVLPSDTTFNTNGDDAVKAWKTEGGHILVHPTINGKDVGCMILDTGASGFVIEKSVADELKLSSFGELFVAGMSGKIPSQFRRADSFQLGPVVINKPLFMEMPVEGLLSEKLPEPLVGIIGFDLFRSAVVEMRPPEPESGAGEESAVDSVKNAKLSAFSIKLYDPREIKSEEEESGEGDGKHELDVPWQDIKLIAGLPHLDVEFSISDSDYYTGLFLVDTGAGGSGAMFLPRAGQYPQLRDALCNSCTKKTYMSGVGGHKAKLVNSGELDWLEVAGKKHFGVPYLYIKDSYIDISVYSYGILCMLVLAKCRLVFDYANNRAAFVPVG